MDFENFSFQLGRSPFISSMSGAISILLPGFELLLAVLLIFRKTRLLGLYGSFFMMALFTGYVFIMLRYSYDLPCSCGGILEQLTWENHLVFNALFTLLTVFGIFLQNKILADKRDFGQNELAFKAKNLFLL